MSVRSEVSESGRGDLNPRPPAPKAGALTELRYSPVPRFLVSRRSVTREYIKMHFCGAFSSLDVSPGVFRVSGLPRPVGVTIQRNAGTFLARLGSGNDRADVVHGKFTRQGLITRVRSGRHGRRLSVPQGVLVTGQREAPMAEYEEGEVVILSDENGDYFVVSKEVVDRGKLEGDLKDAVVEAAESDVAGFSFNWGSTQFQPQALSAQTGPASGSPYQVIGTFQYRQPMGVDISRILLPGG